MIFTIRRSVDLTNIGPSLLPYQKVNIELALPYRVTEFLDTMAHMGELEEFVLSHGLRIVTVRSTQGRLSDEQFFRWAIPAVRLARLAGARAVIFHPENVRRDQKSDLRMLALQHARQLQRDAGDVTICCETFGGPKVLITPEEMRDLKPSIPMCLDVSHLFPHRSLELIQTYSTGIVVVHLSEPPAEPQHTPHMPVGPVSYEVLRALRAKAWKGIVTLEYMPVPAYQDRLLADRQRLEDEFGSKGDDTDI
jgi:sugar phosphate isomerase/epimerase